MLEPLQRRIDAGFAQFTKSEKLLAHYLTASPEGLLVESSVSLARSVGVSPMTISRFVRKVGFKSLADARSTLKREVFGRGADSRKPVAGRSTDKDVPPQRHEFDPSVSFDAEVAAMKRVYALRELDGWAEIVESIAKADRLFIAGFQTTRGIALTLADRLEYIRPHVRFVDGMNGTYVEVLEDRSKRIALVIIDTYRYSRNARVLAERSAAAGAEVTVISDEFCHWAREATSRVLSVTTATGLSRPSMTGFSTLSDLLVEDVSEQLGDELSFHLDAVACAQEWFGQYE